MSTTPTHASDETTPTHTSSEAVIIGGGPAGLQAALTLGRIHRRVLLIDSGEYRNAPADHMHNVITHDGRPPADFRELAHRDLAAYKTVTVVRDRVEAIVEEDEGFEIRTTGQYAVRAPKVLLATGVRDALPDVPGLAALFGSVVAHCPFCHGHEFAGRPVGILGAGAPAAHVSALMAPVASELVVLANGATPEADVAARLDSLGVPVRTESVSGLTATTTARPDGLAGGSSSEVTVSLANGDNIELAGLFVAPTFSQSAPFAEQLGLEVLPSGCVAVDEFGRTSRSGVFAAGDLAHLRSLPMPLSSVVSALAAGQVAASAIAMDLIG